MKKSDLINIIREELQLMLREAAQESDEEAVWENQDICEGDGCLEERTIASHEPPRKMSKLQVSSRKKMGLAMKKDPRVVDHFKKKHGQDWESYMWAAASSKAFANKKKK
jgi:hypothetical protein